MNNINISLPKTKINLLDRIVRREGFSSRSALLRALINWFTLSGKPSFELEEGPKAKPEKVRQEFEKTGLYSKAFLDDLERGLNRSRYYQ